MIENLAQKELYFPGYMTSNAVIGLNMRVCRLSDGYWWDFGGVTPQFRASGWTTKSVALVKDDDAVWRLAAGWRVPFGEYSSYQVVFETNQGIVYSGPKITVNRMIDVIVETGTLTTIAMTTDIVEATTDHFVNRVLLWLTGVLAGQVREITAYAGAGGEFGYDATTDTPSNGDRARII